MNRPQIYQISNFRKYRGVINVGGKKFQIIIYIKKKIKNLSLLKRKNLIKKLNFIIAKDSSLNIKKFQKIKSKYE